MNNQQFEAAAAYLSGRVGQEAKEGARLRIVEGLSIEKAAAQSGSTRSSLDRFSKRVLAFAKAAEQYQDFADLIGN